MRTGGQLRPGSTLDRYEIVRLIAAGGMGEVYEATHAFTGRVVALKCLKLQHAHREDLRRRMQMEAVALCKMNHPNLVTVYDAGITDGVFWIAMDRLVGRTLREALASRGALPFDEARRIAAEIADGVAAAHALSVVHRDLKPENVFLTERGEVKVLDLGTAKFYGWGAPATESLRVLGTPQYMSPEQVRGEALGPASDVYALGVMLYEMLSARHPYAVGGAMPSSLDVGPLHLFADPVPLLEVAPAAPSEAWEVVQRALSKSPEERPRTMAEFAASLRALRSPRAPSAALGPKTVVLDPAAIGERPRPAAWAPGPPASMPISTPVSAPEGLTSVAEEARGPAPRRTPLVAVGAGLTVGLAVAALGSFFLLSRRGGEPPEAPGTAQAPEASPPTVAAHASSSETASPAALATAAPSEDSRPTSGEPTASPKSPAPPPSTSNSARPPLRAPAVSSPPAARPRPPTADVLPKSGL